MYAYTNKQNGGDLGCRQRMDRLRHECPQAAGGAECGDHAQVEGHDGGEEAKAQEVHGVAVLACTNPCAVDPPAKSV